MAIIENIPETLTLTLTPYTKVHGPYTIGLMFEYLKRNCCSQRRPQQQIAELEC